MNNIHEDRMSGRGEGFGVAACVDGVISAFQTGFTKLEQTKERRKARGAPPLPRLLEESIAQAPEEIEREKRRGIDRFGSQFEVGDYSAIIAIQQVTIQLQCSLLQKIGNIDDEVTDFKALARAADKCRDDTITTLIGLRQRLLQAETEDDMSNLAVSTNIAPLRVRSREVKDATLSPLSPVSYTSSTRAPTVPPKDELLSRFEPQSSASLSKEVHRRDSSTPSVRSEQHTISSSASTRATTATTMRTMSSGSAVVQNSKSVDTPKPSRKNNYLGFCKAAWKLQSGDDKAFVKSKDWTQSAQSNTYCLACSRFRCEFRSELKSSGNPSVIWNKLFIDKERGIKYRWSFLAKSHVTQKTVTNKDYSYQCLFCVFQGLQVPVMNLTALLEHISTEHRPSPLSDVVLDRTGCVNNRVCKDGEKFDINLVPFFAGNRPEAFPLILHDDLGEEMKGAQRAQKGLREVSDKVFELYAG